MEERLPLYEKGVSTGILLRREEGLHTAFSAECSRGQGMRKLWLCGETGERLLLGTLLPEEGRWRLRRRLSRSELQRRSLAGAVWGELVLEGEVQTGPSAAVGPVTPRDPVIAQALDKNRSGRWSRWGTEWRLSFPWQIGQPVPLLPLFCFARPEGRELVFLLDETGYPAMHE